MFYAPDTVAGTGVRYEALSLDNLDSVICLLSAARMREITDKDP